MLRIRPPRKPKNEPASVTIANQQKQLTLLLQRVEDLVEERGALKLELSAIKQDRIKQIDRADGLVKTNEELRQFNQYYEGYIARVKDENAFRGGVSSLP